MVLRSVGSRWMAAVAVGVTAVALPGLAEIAFSGRTRPQDDQTTRRMDLIETLRAEGIKNERVLTALANVPRHVMVPEAYADQAYGNYPLPIGHGQTISQPYVVALMTDLLQVEAGAKVLEIGTGSGYQAAVLAELDCDVLTMEIVPELAKRAATMLADLGYDNVQVKLGDGYLGWPEEAPFDGVIVTAAPEEIPQPLIDQLRPGGRLVIPVGPVSGYQYLSVVEKEMDGTVNRLRGIPVRFVPLVHPQPQ